MYYLETQRYVPADSAWIVKGGYPAHGLTQCLVATRQRVAIY